MQQIMLVTKGNHQVTVVTVCWTSAGMLYVLSNYATPGNAGKPGNCGNSMLDQCRHALCIE